MESVGYFKDVLKSFPFKNRKKLLVSICFLIFIWNASNTIEILKTTTSSVYGIREIKTNQKKAPICMKNLLKANHGDFNKQGREFSKDHLVIGAMSSSSSCRLLHFTTQLVVKCMDIVNQQRQQRQKRQIRQKRQKINSNTNKKLHFAFMGDSRIRQHFFSFAVLFPDYDKIITPNPNMKHEDTEISSEILNVRLSYQWRPVIDEQVTTTIEQYTADANSRPDMLLIGMAIHHMLQEHDTGSIKVYKKKLRELVTKLDQLGNLTKLIWVFPTPTIDEFNPHWHGQGREYVFREKFELFNNEAHKILRAYRNIFLWNSTTITGEEYIRGCRYFERHGHKEYFFSWYTANCKDYVHHANNAMAEATQLLYNDFCNKYFVTN